MRFRAYVLTLDRTDRWGADVELDHDPDVDEIVPLPEGRRVSVTHLLGPMAGYDGSFAGDELPPD